MFKNAFADYNLQETQTVILSTGNSVEIIEVNYLSQRYNAAVAKFRESTGYATDRITRMLEDYTSSIVTPDTIEFLTTAVVVTSSLTDDDGNAVKHDPDVLADQLLTYPRAAAVIMQRSMMASTFKVETKN